MFFDAKKRDAPIDGYGFGAYSKYYDTPKVHDPASAAQSVIAVHTEYNRACFQTPSVMEHDSLRLISS
jgi:hypothetical protein